MTDIKTLGLFPVPVNIANFGKESKELNESLIADSFSEQAMNPVSAGRSAIDGWQSEGYMDEKYESFAILRENIKTIIYSLLPSYGFDYDGSYDDIFECGMLWSNILTQHSAYHIPHIHGTGETLFSGVYYPTSGLTSQNEDYYPEEDYSDVEIRASSVPESGDLVLFDPAAAQKRQVIPAFVKRYPYYGSEICIRPKKAHLIIFPNYMTHMVAPIKMNNFYRLSISFSLRKK
jgi:hypothetical protein